jgi:hypothetical protein
VLLLLLLRSRCAIELSKQSTRIKCNSFVPAALSLSLARSRSLCTLCAKQSEMHSNLRKQNALWARHFCVHPYPFPPFLSHLSNCRKHPTKSLLCVCWKWVRAVTTHTTWMQISSSVCVNVCLLFAVYMWAFFHPRQFYSLRFELIFS